MSEDNPARESYTRVSTVLYPFSGLSDVPQDLVEHAANRGTKVHQICQGIVTGLGEFGVDDETRPYVESFMQWYHPHMQFKAIEQRFYCERLMVTGQCDYIVDTPEGLALVDLKTSYRPSKTWQIQGQAYAYLAALSGYDIKHIWFLHLQKSGKPPKIYSYDVCDALWKSVFYTWKYFYHKPKKTND